MPRKSFGRIIQSLRSRSPQPPATGPPASSSRGSETPSELQAIKGKASGLGIRLLYKGDSACVDVVFVHGLTGSAYSTWLHEKKGVHWPAELLKKDIPDCRILTFGYDADVVKVWQQVSGARLSNHGKDLVADLAGLRNETETSDRSIVFVAHSLGGLVVQSALGHSRNNSQAHLAEIEKRTIGIAFLGTPHHGADIASWGSYATAVVNIARNANKDIVRTLKPDSEMLQLTQENFYDVLERRKKEDRSVEITCFYEELEVKAIGFIVPQYSAKLSSYSIRSIHANHMDMTKFPDRNDQGYIRVVGEIKRWIKNFQTFQGHNQSTEEQSMQQHKNLKPSSNVPFRQDEKFIGREQILARLTNLLENHREHSRAALFGKPGVGKTQIAIEFSYQFGVRHPNTWVFWVYCSTSERFEQSFRGIASRLKLPKRDEPDTDVLQLVHEWLSNTQNGSWLMILDNADNERVLYSGATAPRNTEKQNLQSNASLASFVPQTTNGCVLITSRTKQLASELALGDYQLQVDGMDHVEAMQLFSTKTKVSAGDEAACKELLEELAFLPLAVAQAAAYINSRAPRVGIAWYLSRLRGKLEDARIILDRNARDSRRDEGVPISVLLTWSISFDQIREQSPEAATLLSHMSMLDRQAMPEFLFHEGDDSQSFEDALAWLLDFSLVTAQYDQHTLSMHRLVQLLTRTWLEDHNELRVSQNWALARLGQTFPPGDYKSWKECEILLPHANIVLEYTLPNLRDLRLDLYTMKMGIARYYLSHGKYSIAQTMYEQALAGAEQELGPTHPDTLASVSNLALVLQDRGQYEEAETLNRRALAGREQELGPTHLDTLTSVGNLALLLYYRGQYEEAETMNRRALAGREQELGPTHPDTLTSINNLASVLQYQGQGQYEEAETMYRRALAGSEQELGPTHPDTLTSVWNLGALCQDLKKCSEASVLYQRACSGFLSTLGPAHPTTLACIQDRERRIG